MYSIFSRNGDWKTFYKNAPVTSILIIINTVMLLVTLLTGGFQGEAIKLGAIIPFEIINGEYWRIITAAFLHGGVLHFLSNMIIGLLSLSSALERLIGSKKFLIIYVGSLLISGGVVLFFTNYPTIGASGAIFGVLGALLYITVYRKDMLSYQDSQSIRALIFINIVFTFLGANISIPGHIGGIAAGYLISFLVIKRNIFKVMH